MWDGGCSTPIDHTAALRATLLLLLARKSRLTLCLDLSPIPHFLLHFLRVCPQRGAPLLLPFYLGEGGRGSTECVSNTLHHIQSTTLPCLFSSPPSPDSSLLHLPRHRPAPALQSLPPRRLSAPDEDISKLIWSSFHYFSSSFNWLRRCHIASAQRLRLWRLITAV